jgi:hypothetical protein
VVPPLAGRGQARPDLAALGQEVVEGVEQGDGRAAGGTDSTPLWMNVTIHTLDSAHHPESQTQGPQSPMQGTGV